MLNVKIYSVLRLDILLFKYFFDCLDFLINHELEGRVIAEWPVAKVLLERAGTTRTRLEMFKIH